MNPPHPTSYDWEQLLLRPLTPPDPATISAAVAEKRILVTGAGGSIGAALATALAPAPHAGLLLLDSSEQALYQLDRALQQLGNHPRCQIHLGNAGDPHLLASLFHQHSPHIVIHAAAFKHVPLLEQNPFAAIANNTLAVSTLLQTLLQAAHPPEHFLLVSTDKAVDPSSLMGASKRIAELILLAPAPIQTHRTAVRLGNVLGSSGSVVPLFLDQIARGTPLMVTHPQVRRFFMTINEAITAILSALTPEASTGASPARILVPDLGPSIRVADLARHLLKSNPDAAGPITYTALRPGDKLEEALLSPRESWASPSTNTFLRSILSPDPPPDLAAALAALEQAVHHRDLPALLSLVRRLVPEYTPSLTLSEYQGIPA